MNLHLIEHEETQKMVDYSFGDHSGTMAGVPNAYMKKANIKNFEFVDFIKKIKKDVITLFIDNIRLYKRPLDYSDWYHEKPITVSDKEYLKQYDDEDLLELCSFFPDKEFIIFTAFEDTPLDSHIIGRIPTNVRSIHAVNSVFLCDKIHPMPHGIERIMYPGYNHHEILSNYIINKSLPEKLLYVNYRKDTGTRARLDNIFDNWATVSQRLSYEPYLEQLKNHKFILCPSGNGIESARNWETLYLKRVPVFERHPYMELLFQDFPVLFIDKFENLTEDYLNDHLHLVEEAQQLDYRKLDLVTIFNKKINI